MSTKNPNLKYFKGLLIFLGITFSVNVYAQSELMPPPVPKNSEVPIENSIIEFPDKNPEFPGGNELMVQYIKENIKYPKNAKKDNISGVVYLSFVVEPNGEITNITLARGVNELLDKEAIRVVESMPKWEPGEANGKVCRTRRSIPVRFVIAE